MKLSNTLVTSLFVAVASIPASSYAAVVGPQPTAAPQLQKRVFPTGSAAVASFLSTIDPAELSTYFSWAANGNDGFISHAQSFTSANGAQFSSYLAAKNIGSTEYSLILGGIQTESTQGGGGAGGSSSAGSESGSGSGSSTVSGSSGSTATGSSNSSSSTTINTTGLSTLPNGAVVSTLSNGGAVQGISANQGSTLVPVSTTGAGGSLVPASTTYASGAPFLTQQAAGSTASTATGGAASSSAAPAAASSGAPDGALPSISLNCASLLATLFAALLAACLVL